MREGRRGALFATLAMLTLGAAGCAGGGGENEYYQAYLASQAEVEFLGSQLDSTLIRIRDLESAVTAASSELASAQPSITDAELFASRDPGASAYHLQQAGERITRARSLLDAVAP